MLSCWSSSWQPLPRARQRSHYGSLWNRLAARRLPSGSAQPAVLSQAVLRRPVWHGEVTAVSPLPLGAVPSLGMLSPRHRPLLRREQER